MIFIYAWLSVLTLAWVLLAHWTYRMFKIDRRNSADEINYLHDRVDAAREIAYANK